jgi:ATP-binding cassette subfamily C protein
MVAVAIVLAGASALGLVTPWALGRIVDLAISDSGTGDIAGLAGLMVLAAVGSAILTGVGVALSARLFETILAQLREDMMQAALRLPLARVESAGTGDLVSRVTDDVSVVSFAISRAAPAVSTSLFTIVITALGLALVDWRFLLVLVTVVPIYAVGVRMYLRVAPDIYASERAAMADRAHHVLGSIHGLATVRAFGLSGILNSRIATYSWEVVRWALRARTVQNRFFARLNLGEYVGMATILAVGFFLVGGDIVTVGATTTAMLFFLRLFDPIAALLFVVDDLQSGAASLGRIIGVIEAAEDQTSGPAEADVSPVGRELTASGVTFAYSADRPVLDHVSLRIRDGEHVALVGASGAGKSTLAILLAGVHSPGAGTITFGGVEISVLDESTRSRRIALVTQEVHVFAGPLSSDLRMAAPDATADDLRTALQAVSAWEWVNRLPDGVETMVGPGGEQLSPMQQQQLALARLMLLDPDVVILDEATADAGSAGADMLESAAEAAMAGRSALIVAHRLSQAARADRVVLMDKGAIVEEGTHAELVERGGRYAALWTSWAAGRV